MTNNLSIYTKDSLLTNSQKDFSNIKSRNLISITSNLFNKKFKRKKFNDELKGTVDFAKMSDRNFEIILNKTSLQNPSFYRYQPKFNFITEKTKGVIFGNKKKIDKSDKKKYMLKKIMCSYGQISENYCIIDNSKLIDKNKAKEIESMM